MNTKTQKFATFAGLVLLLVAFAADARAVTIATVPVGNAGNAGDVQSQGTFGGVGYDYRIGTYEVTNAQYAEFLNAKAASDTLDLYNTGMSSGLGGITRSGASGSYTYAANAGRGDMPVAWVTWYDAIRFANWLHNGQGSGDTETGAYTLLGGTPVPSNGNTIARNAGATWVLTSEDEWYKAAYHKNDGVAGNYFDYPTSSDTAPTGEAPPGGGNSANYNNIVGDVTDVGAYTASDSPYGTFDQGGNVWDWNEALITGSYRGLRGGGFLVLSDSLLASNRPYNYDPTTEYHNFGFRVASVPEPSTFALAALGILGLLALRKRRRSIGSAIVLLALLAGIVPAQAATYTFTSIVDTTGPLDPISRIAINNSGAVAFLAYLSGGAQGIFVGSGGPITTLYDSSGPLREFGFPALNDGGTVAFSATLDAGGQGIFKGNGGPTTTIAGGFSYTDINNDGRVAFRSDSGIFSGDGGPVTTIAHTSGPFSGGFNLPSINNAGLVAFGARLDTGAEGIFTGNGSPTTTIVDNSEFNFFNGLAINDSGTVVFQAGLKDLSGTGIFTVDGAFTMTIADPSGPYSSFDGSPAINNLGLVAFIGWLDGGGRGIFTGPDPVADKVIALGDSLFNSSITDLHFYHLGLNDGGQLAFWYQLASGTQGIAVATPVPEPSTLVLAGVGTALLGLGTVRRRRRHALVAHAGTTQDATWLPARSTALLLALLLLSSRPVWAVTIPTVPVGNPGNAGDVQSQGTFGGVSHAYRIGTTEVTNSQYAEFLNAKAASDPLALYSPNMGSGFGGITRSGLDGSYDYDVIAGRGDMPVNFVSWYDAVRFANWLNNGQGSGDTETGAYTLLGGTPIPSNGLSISRNAGATWFLTSENEWYKAAYYDSTGSSYFDYPTASNTAPTAEVPPGGSNSANNNSAVGDLTNVGAYTASDSPYGTFDQGGNLWEWNEALIGGSFRGFRGGSFIFLSNSLLASFRNNNLPTFENNSLGFRVASVPEPSSLVLAALGICGAALFWKRRVCRSRSGVVALFALLVAFVADAQAVTIDTVPVGNAGNAGDLQSQGTFGAVAYNYRIGTYEVTVAQYTEFLNAVAATDTYGLYNPSMGTNLNIAGISQSGSPGAYSYSVIGSANKPVTYVNWGDAARFSNWLHNGQPTGAQNASTTEDGAYPLNGATTDAALNAVSRNAAAQWFIPSENEWYKAAYHQPTGQGGDGDNYWAYPTRTNSTPYSDQPPGTDAPTLSNTANVIGLDSIANGYDDGYAVTGSDSYSASQNYLTDVGAYTSSTSSYGTFDQGGNVVEWNEALIGGSFRCLRGGAWNNNSHDPQSSARYSVWTPSTEVNSFGFRVATVAEPSTLVLAALGICGAALYRKRRVRRPRCAAVVLIAVLVAFATDAQAVTIPTVPVGNAGNAGDVQSQGTFGAVAYDYRIGTYEVTVGQYTAFLNAVAATDTYGLYHTSMAMDLNIAGIARSGVSGSHTYSVIGSPNKPVTYVSWGDAARFSNWLHNGQPTGLQGASTTEDGAYTLNGAITSAALNAVSRNAGATWFMPSEDEWYKAAYHKNDGATGNYWDYPTSTDSTPYSDQPPGSGAPTQSNTANFYKDDTVANGYDDGYAVPGSTSYSSSQNYLTDVGAYTSSRSPYGTFDQGGNVREWNEALISGSDRGLRGGSPFALRGSDELLSSSRSSVFPAWETSPIGFRVASVPEPSTAVLAILACGLLRWWRRRLAAPERSP